MFFVSKPLFSLGEWNELMWMEKRGKFWGFSSVCPPAAGSHAALAASGKTPKVSIFVLFCFAFPPLLLFGG